MKSDESSLDERQPDGVSNESSLLLRGVKSEAEEEMTQQKAEAKRRMKTETTQEKHDGAQPTKALTKKQLQPLETAQKWF